MNDKGVLPIFGLPVIIAALIVLVLFGGMLFFFKSTLIAIIGAVIGGYVLFKVSDNLDKKDAQAFAVLSIILIFASLFVGVTQPLSIVGGNEPIFVNQLYTADVSVTSSVEPDTVYSDGSVTYLAGQTTILDSSGNIVFSSPIEDLSTSNYVYGLEWTPTQIGDYAIVAAVLAKSSSFDYVTGQWSSYSDDEQVGLEKIGVSVQAITPPVEPIFNFVVFFGELWSGITSWFIGLFGYVDL